MRYQIIPLATIINLSAPGRQQAGATAQAQVHAGSPVGALSGGYAKHKPRRGASTCAIWIRPDAEPDLAQADFPRSHLLLQLHRIRLTQNLGCLSVGHRSPDGCGTAPPLERFRSNFYDRLQSRFAGRPRYVDRWRNRRLLSPGARAVLRRVQTQTSSQGGRR